MSTVFDINAFIAQPQGGEFSTKYQPMPVGEYRMQIQGPFGDDKATKLRQTDKGQIILDVVYLVDGLQPTASGTSLIDETGMPTSTVRQSIFLEFTPEGGLSKAHGKNVKLGQLLDALGLNGKPWTWNSLIGGMVVGKVTHRMANDEVYADVKSVTKA